MNAITQTNLPLKKFSSGKVRDTYEIEDDLLMVATDRLSAFDVVFGQGIPYKGLVLTEISKFWFEQIESIIKTHVKPLNLPDELLEIADELKLQRRAMRVVRAKPIMLECVVRGYLVGSGWEEYKKNQSVCGIKLPNNLQNAQKLDEPIFTPSTKAQIGEHDENIGEEVAKKIVGKDTFELIKQKSIQIYKRASEYALTKDIILADTKFEFGMYNDEIILIDEVLTPDSSRYWPKDKYEIGKNPPSFDKQYVRDYVSSLGWNKRPPAPALPKEVIDNTTNKYIEVYEKITGRKFVR